MKFLLPVSISDDFFIICLSCYRSSRLPIIKDCMRTLLLFLLSGVLQFDYSLTQILSLRGFFISKKLFIL